MIVEIIKHTPNWVFILFIGLVVLGYSQTKDRRKKLNRILILPIVIILLSISGIYSAFGTIKYALILYFIGGVISLVIGLKLSFPKNVKYNKSDDSFNIPGSWIPMILILIIFFIKYFVAVVIARKLPIASEIEFIAIISLLYGILCGIFVSRSIVTIKSKYILK